MVDTSPVMTDLTLVSILFLRICIYLLQLGKLYTHKYENAMTVQRTSWGYIRNTNISGYLSIEELLYQLVSTVRWVRVVCVICAQIYEVANVWHILYVTMLTFLQYWWQYADECGPQS